jgi:hypothetical protein
MGITLLPGMETNARNDLKDLDSTNYLWTTAELDRHIQHAVNDYQRIVPLMNTLVWVVVSSASQGPTTPITSRQAITPLPTGYLWTIRVEYPIDQEPPQYLMFREEIADMGSLYFPIAQPPVVGQNMKIWYAQAHTLSAATSTILTEHEEVISLGAVAYAAQAATRYAQHRLNASAWTPKGIQAFANERMLEYLTWLDNLRAAYSSGAVPFIQWGQFPWDWTQV